MGKPWEEYQKKPAVDVKPWEEYAPAATSTVEQGDGGPQLRIEAPSWGETASGAIQNIPSSAAKYAGGIIDAVTHPGATIQGVADIAAGGLRKVLPKDVVKFIDSFDNNPEATQRATEVFKQVGGEYSKNYGTVEGFKRHLMNDPVSVMADLSMVAGAGAGVAGKAGAPQKMVNALNRTAEVTNPLALPGKLWDKGLNVAKRGGEGVANFVRSFKDQKGQLYERAAAGKEGEIINALEKYQSPIPGYKPTAYDVAAHAGGPEFAAFGKSAEHGTLRGELYNREMANQAALGEAVNRMAFKPTNKALSRSDQTTDKLKQIKKQEAVRGATAEANYKVLDDVKLSEDAVLSELFDLPAMKKAIPRAQELARNKRQEFVLFHPDSVRPEPTLSNALGKPLPKSETVNKPREYTGTGLHYLKMALDDMKNDPATFGIGKSEVGAISDLQKELVKYMDTKIPGYEKARKIFVDQTKPIEQMDVAKYLSEKLTPAIGEGAANLRAESFAKAMQDAPATVKKVTDRAAPVTSLRDVLTSSQYQVVEDVFNELQKKQASDRKAGLAKGPEFDVSQSTKISPGEQLLPGFLNRVTTTANHIWKRMRGGIDQQVAVDISRELLDPKKTAQVLKEIKMAREIREFKKRPMPQSRGMTSIDNAIIKAVKSPVSPQLMNALNAGREPQPDSLFEY